MKALITIIIIFAVLVGGFFALNHYIYQEKQASNNPKEVAFFISGEPVRLSNGEATTESTLGQPAASTIRYFGNELVHDIDGDGREDTVFLITQETGGSGIFFYAVGALNKEEGYVGTHAVLIGDRIAPQTTEKGEGRSVVINYADRAPGEPFTTSPSIGKSLYLLLDTETLEFGELVQNFEGEEA